MGAGLSAAPNPVPTLFGISDNIYSTDMRTRNLLCLSALVAAMVSLSACDGMFSGIYDDAEEEETSSTTTSSGYGFVSYTDYGDYEEGTIYIVTTDYYLWTYLNFHTHEIDSLIIDLDLDDPLADEPTDWDIAVHRWDARTNGGSALETGYTGFSALISDGMPSGTFVEDEPSQISVDMSQMMSGIIGYLDCDVNLELSKWIDVDTSGMPPTYTLSNRVYLVHLTDDTYIALKLSDYMNSSGTKGYLTIDYIYPIDL